MIYLQLFITYLKIGLFSFGGGYAMLSFVEFEVVKKHAWISPSDFTDIVAISQMTPGPIGINTATYVGYTATGSVLGSAIATIAVCLPSFLIMLAVCKFLLAFRNNRWIDAALDVIKPLSVGLIAVAALSMINTENFIDYKSVLIFIGAFFFTWKWKVHPILMLLLAGFVGFILY
ncbi:MAG: chromate transporter [Bacteroidales bacterium]|nr:chromate transporter [Bacteroidales bacterium]